MSDASPPELVTELQVSAHLMRLEAGVYCVHHASGSMPPDPTTGLPGARLSRLPGTAAQAVSIAGFSDDGWLGALDAALLVRVTQGPAQVLVTVYQSPGTSQPPRLQVTRLASAVPAPVAAPPRAMPADMAIAAHIQHRGDVSAALGDWVGERGSQHAVEGFSLSAVGAGVAPDDIEYQAVLGRGWLSPWAAGTQYCGSRGMALSILGLRVRLRGAAATTHTLRVSGTFTDGAAVGPVGPGEACEAESLAPLEAFRIEIMPLADPPVTKAVPRPRKGRSR